MYLVFDLCLVMHIVIPVDRKAAEKIYFKVTEFVLLCSTCGISAPGDVTDPCRSYEVYDLHAKLKQA